MSIGPTGDSISKIINQPEDSLTITPINSFRQMYTDSSILCIYMSDILIHTCVFLYLYICRL
jgi:hypothetical protein